MLRTGAARPDAVRRHNLALVLEQIHLHGALTRAELTHRSGLSRSTIGGLVTELALLDLVRESVPVGGTRAGRPSHVVLPRPDGPFAVAVDIDVAHVTTAAVGIGGHVLARHVVPADAGPVQPEAVAAHVAQALPVLQELVGDRARPVGVGVSVPGTVDSRSGVVGQAPNLGWRDVPLGELVQRCAAGLRVAIGNDADLAVLAEHRRGSARGCTDVVYLLGRVGVGAGILVDGQPLRGAGGLAGEVGHTVLHPGGHLCHCGGRGCVETYVGDAALLRLVGEPVRPVPAVPARQTQADGRVHAVLTAAAQGHQRELRAVRALAGELGRVVGDVVNLLNPQVVVMGGTLREVLVLAGDAVQAALDRAGLAAARAMVHLEPAALGDDGSLLGAAELAFGSLLADPLALAAP